jgi:hypothetical protein
MKSISFTSSNNKIVSSVFTGNLIFTLNNMMSLTDTITISLPNEIGPPNSVSLNPLTQNVYSINGSIIKITNFTYSSTILSNGFRINATLINCTNPVSSKLVTDITVEISRNGAGVQKISTSYQATSGSVTLNLTPVNSTTNFTGNCLMSITTSTLVPNSSYLLLQYPYTITPLTLSSTTVSCFLGTTNIPNCSYKLSGSFLMF